MNAVLYNTLLKGFAERGDLRACWGVLSEFEADGMRPNHASFNTMLRAAVAANDAQAIEEAQRQARSSSCDTHVESAPEAREGRA